MDLLIKLGDTPEERAIKLVKTHKVIINDMEGNKLCQATYMGDSEANAMLKIFRFEEDGFKSIAGSLEVILSDGNNQATIDGFYNMDELGNPTTFTFFKDAKKTVFEKTAPVKEKPKPQKSIRETIAEIISSKGEGRVIGLELPNVSPDSIDKVCNVVGKNGMFVGRIGFIGVVGDYYLFNTGQVDDLSWLDTNSPRIAYNEKEDSVAYEHVTLFANDGTVEKRVEVGTEVTPAKALDNRFGIKISSSIPVEGRLVEGHDYILGTENYDITEVRYSKRHPMDGSIYLFAVHDPRALPIKAESQVFIKIDDNKVPIPVETYYLGIDEPSPKPHKVQIISLAEEPAPVVEEEEEEEPAPVVEEKPAEEPAPVVEDKKEEESITDKESEEVDTTEAEESAPAENIKIFGDTTYEFTQDAPIDATIKTKSYTKEELLSVVNAGAMNMDLQQLIGLGWVKHIPPSAINIIFNTVDKTGTVIGTQEVNISGGKGLEIVFNNQPSKYIEGEALAEFLASLHSLIQKHGG